jgi:hypothetical protein
VDISRNPTNGFVLVYCRTFCSFSRLIDCIVLRQIRIELINCFDLRSSKLDYRQQGLYLVPFRRTHQNGKG